LLNAVTMPFLIIYGINYDTYFLQSFYGRILCKIILGNMEIRAALDHHWKFTGVDIDKSHEIYRDDVVVEFPQSGEKIRGIHNLYEFRKHYPSKLCFKILRTRGEGNLWITELIVTYDGRPVNGVCIMEFLDEKIAHETLYFGDPFEPPEWRSKWVELSD
jgi:hypothetical protein